MEKKTNFQNKLQIADYTILSIIAAFFYIDFIPVFRAIEVRGVQFLYMSILNLCIGASFFAFPSLISQTLIDILRKSIFVKVYLLFLALSFLSYFTANNTSVVLVTGSQILILSMTIFNFIVLLYDKKYLFYHICFVIGVFTFIKSFNEIAFLISQNKIMGFEEAISTLKGNTGNINIFSASLNIKLPFMILGIFHFSNWKRWVLIIATVFAAFIIYILDSRATILALMLESISILAFLLWKSSNKSQIQNNILASIAPIIVGISIGIFAFSINQKSVLTDTKSNGTTSKVGSIELKDGGSVKQRLDYWSNALQIIKKEPIFGIGLGNWCVESIPYEKFQSNGMMVSVHTHNDFLELATETGLINGIVFLSIFIILLSINIKRLLNTDDELTKNISFLCLLLLIAYGIDSFFNFPLYRPTVQLGLAFLIIFTLINFDKSSNETNQKPFQWKHILLSIFVLFNLITIFFSYNNFLALQLSNELIIDLPNEKKNLTSDYIIDHMPRYPSVMFNSQPFAEYAGIYLVREGKFAQAHKYLNTANKLNPYIGRVEWYKYSIAQQTKKLDSAYIYAKQAFAIKPRNYDFFNTMIFMANKFNDTTEILKTHQYYHNLVKDPKNYIETSSGLHNSNYSKKGLVKFIEIGLKEFPNDSLLLRRKKIFEYELKTKINNNNVIAQQVQNLANENNFEKVLKKAENDGAKYLAEAIKLGNENKFQEAVTAYKKVLETQPNNTSVKQNIGILYYKLGQQKTAISWLDQTTAAAVGSSDGKSEYVIAACYMSLKENDMCCKYLEIAVAKNFTNALELQKQICK